MLEYKEQGDRISAIEYNKIVDHINALSNIHGNGIIAKVDEGKLIIDGKRVADEGQIGRIVYATNKVVRMPSWTQVNTNDHSIPDYDHRLDGTITFGTPVALQHITYLWRMEDWLGGGAFSVHSQEEYIDCTRNRPLDMVCEKMSFWDMWDTDPINHSMTHNNMPFMAPWSWGIALEDIEPGCIGRVQTDGICLAKVLINEGVHHLEQAQNLRLCGSVIGGMNEALISSGATVDAIMLWGPTHKLYSPNQSRIRENLTSLETERLNLDYSKVGTEEDVRTWPLALVKLQAREPVQTIVKLQNPELKYQEPFNPASAINRGTVTVASGYEHNLYGNNIHMATARFATLPNPNYNNHHIGSTIDENEPDEE